MKLRNESKGMTLIEVIVAIAVLGVLLVFIFNIYTRAIMNIEASGQRTEAVYKNAQLIMEEIHNHDSIGLVSSKSVLEGIITSVLSAKYNPAQYSSFNYDTPPTSSSGSVIIRYGVGAKTTVSGINGYPYTIMVFYKEGKQYVKLSSFIPEGGV